MLPEPVIATKAMAHEPQLKNLYLAVFDQAGYLREYVKAAPVTDAKKNGTKYSYQVKLKMSENPCIIHFIGNAPESVKFGSEETVLNAIKAKNGEDIYWYRRTLSSIAAVAADELVQADPYTQQMLNEVPLVRNFAKIVLNVSDEVTHFTLKKYTVVNVMDEGFAAPYNSSTGLFMEYFNEDGTPKTVGTLTKENYNASVPSTADYISLDDIKASDFPWVDLTDANSQDDACYVYEREKPLSNSPYIIAQGTYKGDGTPKEVYYKIDLRDEYGEYFALLRNFIYTVNLVAVEREGYSSIDEAAASSGTGDISTNNTTASYIYISDGTASLEVGYTEKVVVVDSDNTLETIQVELPFEFTKDLKTNPVVSNQSVEYRINEDFDDTGRAIQSVVARDNEKGIFTVELYSTTDLTKNQSLTLLASYEGEDGEPITLQRTVMFKVMLKPALYAECVPAEVPKQVGSKFDLKITLPEKLSSSMFPLELEIEALKGTIAPDNDHLPVRTGESHFDSNKAGAFYYVKTVTREEYEKSNVVYCHFKTNKAESDTDIRVSNKYFIDGDTHLSSYSPRHFDPLNFSPGTVISMAEAPVNFEFSMPSNEALPSVVTVTLDGLEQADGYEELTNRRIVDGKVLYDYKPTTYDVTLHLQTTDADKQLYVGLDAERFIHAEKTAGRREAEFTGSWDPTSLGTTAGEPVKYTLSIPESGYYAGMVVTVKFDGLDFANGMPTDDKWKYNGNGVYEYEPSSAGKTPLNLKSTISGKRTDKVTFSADGFKQHEPTIEQRDALTATINRTISGEINGFSDSSWNGNEPQFTATISTNGAESQTETGNITRDREGIIFIRYTYKYSLTIRNWNVRYTDDTQSVTITLVHRGNTYTGTCTLRQLINGNVTLNLN